MDLVRLDWFLGCLRLQTAQRCREELFGNIGVNLASTQSCQVLCMTIGGVKLDGTRN